jgi:methyl-accepting chemotaxis protein
VVVGANLTLFLFSVMVAAVLLTSQDRLKVHGPVYQQIKASNDLTADILPPPLYLIETYLNVLEATADDRSADPRTIVARLEQLEKDFNDRRAYWATHDLPPEIHNVLEKRVVPDAQALLAAVRNLFVPALVAKRDSDAQAATREIAVLYARHRAGVDELVRLANQSVDQSEVYATATEIFFVRLTWAILALTFLVATGTTWLLFGRIAVPIRRMTNTMRSLAASDTSVAIAYVKRNDEIGQMAGAVQVFKDKMIEADRLREVNELQKAEADAARKAAMLQLADSFEASIKDVVNSVASQSTEMQSTAQAMSRTAEQTTEQATAVAASVQQASASVQTVATAAEELSASVQEIARQVDESSKIAGRAVGEADRTDTTVESLNRAAQRIGEVVQLIETIAGQTNLLALNATIEAARAGDAGKGFAVVASEVKLLANQTARATEEIRAQIGEIQGATGQTVDAIHNIGATIRQMREIATAIACAVEEQGAATREIAANVQQAAQGTGETATNIEGVSHAASETGAAASQVLSAAGELSRQSETLRRDVDGFLATVRAA